MVFKLKEKIKTYNNFSTIDPGIHTAICKCSIIEEDIINLQWVSFFCNKGTIPKKINSLGEMLWQNKRLLQNTVYIESVQIYSSSSVSMASASRGNLTELSILIGAYINILNTDCDNIQLIYPREWKGQMNDKVIDKRIQRVLDYRFPNEHIRSAVGMVLHILKIL
jgi:hypothetical protein